MPYVTWIDNYSKLHPRGVLKADRRDFSQNLWTVEARTVAFKQDELDMSINEDVETNAIIEAMPSELFDFGAIETILRKLLSPSAYKYSESQSLIKLTLYHRISHYEN